jgi:hypothetical protein
VAGIEQSTLRASRCAKGRLLGLARFSSHVFVQGAFWRPGGVKARLRSSDFGQRRREIGVGSLFHGLKATGRGRYRARARGAPPKISRTQQDRAHWRCSAKTAARSRQRIGLFSSKAICSSSIVGSPWAQETTILCPIIPVRRSLRVASLLRKRACPTLRW